MPQAPEGREQIDGGKSESLFLARINVLSEDDTIEAAVLGFADQIEDDTSLTNADQLRLVQAVRHKHSGAEDNITNQNKGMLAVLAYPFKAHVRDNNQDLMDTASLALLHAAEQFDPSVQRNFTNFAAPIIEDALIEQAPWARKNKLLNDGEPPINTILRFISKVKKATESDVNPDGSELDSGVDSTVILQEYSEILQYIHLPNDVIEQQYGIKYHELHRIVSDLCARFGLPNQASLALMCLEAGVSFDIRPIPDVSELTTIERAVAPLLHLPYEEVANIVGLRPQVVNKVASRLREKFNARSRIELVLMISIAQVEPVQPVLAPFTLMEQRVLPFINLETEEIMNKFGISKYAVDGAIGNAAKKVGVDTRRSLAFYLYNNGFDFDIPEPTRPLVDALDSKQMEFAHNLYLSNKDLAELSGLSESGIGSTVGWLAKKIGAKNRIELMLMSYMYDTGERREPDERTKRERLAEKLGWGALDVEQLQVLLESINPKQKNLINAYYLSEEGITWRTVAENFKMDRTLAIVTAQHGIQRILRMRRRAQNKEKNSRPPSFYE